jgi:hypothetical protein
VNAVSVRAHLARFLEAEERDVAACREIDAAAGDDGRNYVQFDSGRLTQIERTRLFLDGHFRSPLDDVS